MIKYRENRNDITQSVEIDLTGISAQRRQDLEHEITECLKNDKKYRDIFKFEGGNKLVYKTEGLIPKINKNRLNILMVLGNPAIHSVAEGMFFSYEKTRAKGKWREHRFWRALRDCDVLKFRRKVENPTCENIDKINNYKRDCLLNGEYDSDFNIFLLPYFSFPTPASGEYSGVDGITKAVGGDIFAKMKEFEFWRFEGIVLSNNIKNLICFQERALKEIKKHTKYEEIDKILDKPVYKIDNTLKHVTLYTAGPTRLIYTDESKKRLKDIVAGIKAKKKIG